MAFFKHQALFSAPVQRSPCLQRPVGVPQPAAKTPESLILPTGRPGRCLLESQPHNEAFEQHLFLPVSGFNLSLQFSIEETVGTICPWKPSLLQTPLILLLLLLLPLLLLLFNFFGNSATKCCVCLCVYFPSLSLLLELLTGLTLIPNTLMLVCDSGESPPGSCPTSHHLAYIFPLAATLASGTVLFFQPPRAATRPISIATPPSLPWWHSTGRRSRVGLAPRCYCLSLYSPSRVQLCRKPAVCQGSVGPLHFTADVSQEPKAHMRV